MLNVLDESASEQPGTAELKFDRLQARGEFERLNFKPPPSIFCAHASSSGAGLQTVF